jgi:phosphatidylglycerol---prolipoprotein diacylglyceryl transferase
MFPELFKIPFTNFPLNSYGALLALAFIFGLLVMAWLAKRDGLDVNRMYDLGLWVLLAGLIGSKVLMVITEWDSYYRDHPGQMLSLDFFRSGGVFYGGFLGALLASVIVMRLYKLDWWRTADVFAPGIALGQVFGRTGCYASGCCWGKPTTSSIGVHFSERGHELTGVPTIVDHLTDAAQRQVWETKLASLGGLTAPLHLHPVQLYEVAATLVIFVTLLLLFRRRQFHGQIMLAYAILYAAARFIIEYWRDDPRGGIAFFSTSQIIALVLFIGALILYFRRSRQTESGMAAPSPA